MHVCVRTHHDSITVIIIQNTLFGRGQAGWLTASCIVTLTAGSKKGRLQVGGAAVVCKTYG